MLHKLLRSRRYKVAQALFHLLRIQPLELHALLHPKIISSVKLTLRTARLTNQHRRRRRRSLQVFIARQQEIPNPFAPFARLTQMKAKFLHSLEPRRTRLSTCSPPSPSSLVVPRLSFVPLGVPRRGPRPSIERGSARVRPRSRSVCENETLERTEGARAVDPASLRRDVLGSRWLTRRAPSARASS